jgi:uncharacterized protein (TIGR02231 family)
MRFFPPVFSLSFSLCLPFSLALMPAVAAADVIPVASQVSDVTLYPGLAQISRRAEVALPAGQHRLILRNVPRTADLDSLQLEIAGARHIATLSRADHVPPRDAQDPQVQAAEERIKQIEARIAAVQDAVQRAQAAGRGAEATMGFLQQLGANEGLVQADAAALSAIAQMITQKASEASRAVVDAGAEAREIALQLAALEEELATAEADLDALLLEDEERLYIAVDVLAEQAVAGVVTLRYFTRGYGGIGWSPAYELHLDTKDAAATELTVKRAVLLRQDTGENWQDVALTLSTAVPFGQGAPSQLWPHLRRIEEPQPARTQKRVLADVAELSAAPEPVIEPVLAEDAGQQWAGDLSGVAATYGFGLPVSLASGVDMLRLEMDSLSVPAEVTAVAVPARDETAYRVVSFTNSFGEQLLAANGVPRFVDGKLAAVSDFDGLAPGAELQAGFGPIEGLRLHRDVLDQSEGEQGLISRSNAQVQKVEIEVENLTDRAWPLRLLDRVPYSQQEDLEVRWSAQPRPSEENVEKQRGILAWDLELGAGESRTIQLDTTLSWPEGMVLR